jgi:hypothetical protein
MRRVALLLLAVLAAVALPLLYAAWLRLHEAPPPPGEPTTTLAAPVSPGAAAPASPPPRPPAAPSAAAPPARESRAAPEARSDLRSDEELVPEPFFDEAGEPSLAFVRAALAGVIDERLPDRKLSSDELDRLAEAAFRLREAQQALRALPPTPEHAEERRALLEQITRAGEDFAYVLDMTPGEFTARVQSGTGVDTFSEDEEIPEPEYLDELP